MYKINEKVIFSINDNFNTEGIGTIQLVDRDDENNSYYNVSVLNLKKGDIKLHNMLESNQSNNIWLTEKEIKRKVS